MIGKHNFNNEVWDRYCNDFWDGDHESGRSIFLEREDRTRETPHVKQFENKYVLPSHDQFLPMTNRY